MAIYDILQYPDPRLRLKAEPVTDFGEPTLEIVRNMFETLYATPNTAGFAATQFNIQKRIIVIDLSKEKNQGICLINPRILQSSEQTVSYAEGCLSVPFIVETPITRPESLKAEAYNFKGERIEFDCDGFMAKCVQHEIDHLDGILFLDYLPDEERQRIEQQYGKVA